MTTFEDLGLSDKVLKAIRETGWTEPTPVQCAAVPVGFEGKDILAQAQTGTGKTAAYGMIIIGRTPSGSKKPTSLVLSPTRELALQIEQELVKLSYYTNHRVAAIYGGASYKIQFDKLKKGADIVVGTPGRVKDLIEKEVLDISHVKEVVLDEADRMLEMGFEEEVNFIMGSLQEKRQTLLFSATMAAEIMRLGGRFMNEPEKILVSKDEPCSDLVSQYYLPVSRSGKMERLDAILSRRPKALIFCQTKKMVDDLLLDLEDDYKVGALHGDMPQAKREKVIGNFKNDRIAILVATDVAARGIDVSNIDVVVNYDVPPDAETYLHRIGRTGRAGKEGIAISFVTKMEDQRIRRYEDETGKKITKIRIDEIPKVMADVQPFEPVKESRRRSSERTRSDDGDFRKRRSEEPSRRRRSEETDFAESAPADRENPVRKKKSEDVEKTYSEESAEEKPVRKKKSEDVEKTYSEDSAEEKPVRKKKSDAWEEPVKRERRVVKVVESKSPEERMNMVSLKINLGKEDGYGRVQITELVKKAAKLSDAKIGRVGLGSSASFIEVDRESADAAIKAVSDKAVGGKAVVMQVAPKKVPYSEKKAKKTSGENSGEGPSQ